MPSIPFGELALSHAQRRLLRAWGDVDSWLIIPSGFSDMNPMKEKCMISVEYPIPEAGGHMSEIGKDGGLNLGLGGNDEWVLQATADEEQGRNPTKTVMVYLLDLKTMQKEPIGIITERRKSERDDNNAIGMLRLARQEFAKTEEEAKRILIGDYV